MNESIALVWPTEWPDGGHCTILYLGEISDANFTPDDIIDELMIYDFDMYLMVDTASIEYFGPEGDVRVLTLESETLHFVRNEVESALAAVGIRNASEFDEYRPHVTLSDETDFPNSIFLSPPELWWGDRHIKIWGRL